VTKTELGDLVLVGKELDPKLAGLIGSAASSNDDAISDLTSVSLGAATEVAALARERDFGNCGDSDGGSGSDAAGESADEGILFV